MASRSRRVPESDEAWVIIEPYFIAAQERFVAAGLERVGGVTFEVSPEMHDSPRHYAGCSERGSPIVFAPEAADLPVDSLAAIVAHEFGHATDFLYPGEFQLVDGQVRRLGPLGPTEKRADQARVARLRWWSERDHDTVEATADAIGSQVIGRSIGYCGPCDVQCFDRGRPRPKGLR